MNDKEKAGRDRCIKALRDDAMRKGKQPNMSEIESRVTKMQELTDKQNKR